MDSQEVYSDSEQVSEALIPSQHHITSPELLLELDKISLVLRLSARVGLFAMTVCILFSIAIFIAQDRIQSDTVSNAISQFNMSGGAKILKEFDPNASTNKYFFLLSSQGGRLALSSLIPAIILLIPYLHSLRFSSLIDKAYRKKDSQLLNKSINHLVKHYDYYLVASVLLAFAGLILSYKIIDFLSELK